MDCLVTKLKGTVNDDSLNRLGCIKLKGHSLSNERITNTFFKMIYDTESTFYKNKGTLIATTSTDVNSPIVTGTIFAGHFGQGDFNVDFEKYNLIEIELHQLNDDIDEFINWDDFSYCKKLKKIYITHIKLDLSELNKYSKLTSINFGDSTSRWEGITGNISSLKNNTLLTEINLNRCINVVGELSQLGTLTQLSNLFISTTSITGTVEDFVEAQRNAGRTEGSIEVPYIGSCVGVSFNGRSIENKSDSVLTWTSTSITLNNEVINM